jgi:two-component system, OmpR family, response regulator
MKCLVIEDDASTGQYICNGLREAGYRVEYCDNGLDGLHLAINEHWDLVILDRMLPGGVDGLSIIGRLRDLGKRTPVLVVSALSAIEERVRGLRSGGDDYLSKPFAFSELLARVEVLLRRSGPEQQSEPVLQVADLRLDLRKHRVQRGGAAITLQPREFRLLEYLMRREGEVVTRTMLLEGVWDFHFDPKTSVVETHVSRLRGKLDKGFGRELIHTVRGAGYVIRADG